MAQIGARRPVGQRLERRRGGRRRGEPVVGEGDVPGRRERPERHGGRRLGARTGEGGGTEEDKAGAALRKIERHVRAAVGAHRRPRRRARAVHGVPLLHHAPGDRRTERHCPRALAGDEVDVRRARAAVDRLERTRVVRRHARRDLRGLGGRIDGEARLPPTLHLLHHGGVQRLVRELGIPYERAVGDAGGQHELPVPQGKALQHRRVVHEVVGVAGGQLRLRGVIGLLAVEAPVLVGAVARVDGEVLHGLPLLEQPLAAAEVADERLGLAVPRHVAVDVRAGEVFRAGHAEGVGRAGERVPDEVIDARREGAVARVLEVGGIDGPVADHVRERLGGRAWAAVEVGGGDGGAHVVARAVALALPVGPELALGDVVHAEEGELVGLAEDGGRALPGSARLGDEAHAVGVGEARERAVEVLAEHVVARASVGAQEGLVRGGVRLAEPSEEGQLGAHVEAGEAAELVFEVARPGGHRALPADRVEVRERAVGAHEPGQLRDERAVEAAEVALDRARVENVHVVFVVRQHGPAEAHEEALRARRTRRGKRAGLCRRRAVEALAARRLHRVDAVAAVAPDAVRGQVVARVEDLLRVDVVVEGEVRLLERRLRRPGGVVAVDEAFWRVDAHGPGTVHLAAGRTHVHREGEPQARGLADREDGALLPFGTHHLHLRLRVDDVPLVVPVAARVEHQKAAEAKALHRLQVGRDRRLVHMTVHPPPVAPRTAGHRHIRPARHKRIPVRRTRLYERHADRQRGHDHSVCVHPSTSSAKTGGPAGT